MDAISIVPDAHLILQADSTGTHREQFIRTMTVPGGASYDQVTTVLCAVVAAVTTEIHKIRTVHALSACTAVHDMWIPCLNYLKA